MNTTSNDSSRWLYILVEAISAVGVAALGLLFFLLCACGSSYNWS